MVCTVGNRDESISSRDFSRLRELIFDEVGIKLGSEKKIMLEGRIRRRLKERAIPSFDDYCDYLFSAEGLKDELVHLIDVVTTNKTDFFREPRHFEFFTASALPSFFASNADRRPMLVWSAACSTGEEPYTLAMVMSEFALSHPSFSFRILATDVSSTVLKKAQLAIYSGDEVRPVPRNLKVKYFMRGREHGSERVRLVPAVRRLVEFRRLNFMDTDYEIAERFDAIFCRNVMIYFDRPTQQSILEKITQCLAPRAYLFMGHAETLHELDLPLTPVAPALYRRMDGRS